jgi:transposase
MHKALEQINVKLAEVVSDVTGLTGLAIIRAVLRGERDPLQLARLRNVNCKRTEAEIARALHGNWRAEHLFALKQAVALYEFYQQQMRECDGRLQAQLGSFADRRGGKPLPERSRPSRKSAKGPAFDVRGALHRMAGVDLTVLEGIDEGTALAILAEVGTDMGRFATAKQFTSWLGLCPQHQGSAGKLKSRRVRRGAHHAGQAFRLAARGCHHAKHALGAFYRRIQARAGAPKAIVAAARKLAERVYRLLRYGAEYVCQEVAAYEAAYQARVLRGLARRATELGYRLEPVTPAGA